MRRRRRDRCGRGLLGFHRGITIQHPSQKRLLPVRGRNQRVFSTTTKPQINGRKKAQKSSVRPAGTARAPIGAARASIALRFFCAFLWQKKLVIDLWRTRSGDSCSIISAFGEYAVGRNLDAPGSVPRLQPEGLNLIDLRLKPGQRPPSCFLGSERELRGESPATNPGKSRSEWIKA